MLKHREIRKFIQGDDVFNLVTCQLQNRKHQMILQRERESANVTKCNVNFGCHDPTLLQNIVKLRLLFPLFWLRDRNYILWVLQSSKSYKASMICLNRDLIIKLFWTIFWAFCFLVEMQLSCCCGWTLYQCKTAFYLFILARIHIKVFGFGVDERWDIV